MGLSKDLVSQFVKSTHDNNTTKTESTLNGTVKIVGEGANAVTYVRLDGSNVDTPVSSSTEVQNNERVTVSLKDHQATIIANNSNPATTTTGSTITGINNTLGSFSTIIADKADIEYLEANYAHMTNGIIDNAYIDQAKVNNLSANYAKIEDGVITNANIDVAKVNNLAANYARIENGVITNAKIDVADVNRISATYAQLDLANVNNAWIQNGVIKDAAIDQAKVKDLSVDYANVTLSNTNVAWIENGSIKSGAIETAMIQNGAITDAKIGSVSASKLTAGTIDASNITVLNLNASNITAGTLNGQRLGTGSIDLDKLSEEVTTKSDFDDAVEDLNERIDGAIETFTSDSIPTLNNYPASSWTTAALKDQHIGDILYIVNPSSTSDGHCYRFTKINNAYSWTLIKDSDITKALSDISDIQTFDQNVSTWQTQTDGRISTLTTQQTTIEGNLTTLTGTVNQKVDISTFNSLESTVEGNSSTITSLNNRVTTLENDTSVSELTTTVNQLSQTVSSNTASISQVINGVDTNTINLNSLNQTVSGFSSDISSLTTTTNTLSTQYSTLNQDLQGFKTTVSSTYSTKGDLENLEIGGRNLALDTNTPNRSHETTEHLCGEYLLSPSFSLEENKKYSWGLDLVSTGKKGLCLFLCDDSHALITWITNPNGLVNKRYSGSFTINSSMLSLENLTVRVYVSNNAGSQGSTAVTGSAVVSHLKIEVGDKPTDWTLAPEDTTTFKEEYSRFVQTTEGFKSEVSATTAGLSNDILATNAALANAITSTNTKIEQNASSITLYANQVSALSSDIDDYKEDMDQNLTDMSSDLSSQIDSVRSLAQGTADNISTYMSFNNDGLVLGKSDSTVNVKITNDRISFIDKQNEVAYVNKEMLYIENEQILKTLRFGNFVFFERAGSSYDQDHPEWHNMGLKWVT